MKLWHGLGARLIGAIRARQIRRQIADPGPLGQFYREGGDRQLFINLPLDESDWVLDVGGYQGGWTSEILVRYGCRSDIFEPAPSFIAICEELFGNNTRVRLHPAGLGATQGSATFTMADVGTSQFSEATTGLSFKADIIGVSEFLKQMRTEGRLADRAGAIGCLKLNIEGGEYEVLEALLASGEMFLFRCLLIQFHRQPSDYAARYEFITKSLRQTHRCTWRYPMVWERWDLKVPERVR